MNTKVQKIKESETRRKERLQFSKRLTTKVVQSKKTSYNRQKFNSKKNLEEN